ncbi:MAG: exodeoxyribonuclease VII large subunit [Methylococcaceae bacterium]
MNKDIYTVSRLNRKTRLTLNEQIGRVWVEGEVSNYTASAAGHHYFTLKDNDAQVRCALFSGQVRFAAVLPGNGMHVLLQADVSLYEPRGDYQLIVQKLEDAGDGLLMRAFEALKQKLLTEGLFDAARKKPIPALPACIGIITSPTGAAVHDVLSVLKRRFPAIPVLIFPALVQGKEAVSEIIRALERADDSALCDVLILARGGGSLEDLQAFNDELLARTIARLHTPLVTGIGHEVDYTIADFVADWRAPTPSAAAEAVTPDQTDWLNRFNRLGLQLQLGLTTRLNAQHRHWFTLDKRLLTQHPRRKLETRSQRLDELNTRMQYAIRTHLRHASEQLNLNAAHLSRHHPARRITPGKDRLTNLRHRLLAAFDRQRHDYQCRANALAEQLHAVSPLATLSRGYSIVRRADTGLLVRSIADIHNDDLLETRLTDGVFTSRVSHVSKH